jgi:hypothetical protein
MSEEVDIQTIIAHDNCADGIASACILKLGWPEAEIVPAVYETSLPSPAPGIVFVDFSPPKQMAKAYVEAGAYCLDHHEGAEEVVKMFGERGRFSSRPGVSGAILAHEFVIEKGPRSSSAGKIISPSVAELARLVGIRDTWQNQDPFLFLRASRVTAGLLFLGFNHAWHTVADYFYREGLALVGAVEGMGEIALDERQRQVDKAVSHAYQFESLVEGTKVAVFDGYSLSSDAAEHPALADRDLVVGCVSHIEDGKVALRFSMRTRKNFDVLGLARMFEGGGHAKAAGMSVRHHAGHPWECFRAAVDLFEARRKARKGADDA